MPYCDGRTFKEAKNLYLPHTWPYNICKQPTMVSFALTNGSACDLWTSRIHTIQTRLGSQEMWPNPSQQPCVLHRDTFQALWMTNKMRDGGLQFCEHIKLLSYVLVTLLGRLCFSSYRCGWGIVLPFPEVQATLFSHPAPHCSLGLTKSILELSARGAPPSLVIIPDSLGSGWLSATNSASTLLSEAM